MHDVACEFPRAAVRSKDAQKQLARTSLNNACYCSVAGKFEYQKKYDVNVCKQETSL